MTRSRRPVVIANFALTLDGKVSTKKFSSTSYTGPEDKRRLRRIRAMGDALMAGANTVAADTMSMGLTEKALQRERTLRGQTAEPLRVILTNSGRISPQWKVFSNTRTPLIVFTTKSAGAKLHKQLPGFCEVRTFDAQCVPMEGVLQILKTDYSINTLVCEGGPRILRTLASCNSLDRLHITFCNKIFGGMSAPTLSGLDRAFLCPPLTLSLTSLEELEGNVFACFENAKPHKKI